MKIHNQTKRSQYREGLSRLAPGALAFAVTLLALPASAGIVLPNDPLTTETRVAPNVLFILDDSGSMAFDAMPANSISGFAGRAYTINTVYYDPSRTYLSWQTADGGLMTGGTSYDAVYADFNIVGNATIDLADSSSCRKYNRNDDATSGTNSSGTEVCGGIQTFYVPKDPTQTGATYLNNQANYYRYQIHTDGRVVRSQYGTRVVGQANRGCGNKTTDWGTCEYVTPTTARDEAAERVNYATWFSYHRTRMKAAKAGAGVAFSKLGQNVRVGYRTIWGRNGTTTSTNWPTQNSPIPVNYNNGIFSDPNGITGANNNRSRWYDRLYGTIGFNGTPLHGALDNAGRYFSDSSSGGAYGPEAARDQYSCRQNFTILTTDGYWNSLSGLPGEQDNQDGVKITGPGDRSYQYLKGAPYASSASDTLADVAMRYWKNDLRTDLTNDVPTNGSDPGFWQHMVTFGIAIGLAGNTGFKSVAEVPANFSSWPNPNDDEDGDRIDDLLHAAVNGRGQFVSAGDPEAFARGLSNALAAITERIGSFSNVSANSTSLDTGAQVFQASYISGVWTGQVAAYAVTNQVVSSDPTWRASEGVPTSNRKVFSSNGTAGTVFPAGATTAQLAALTRTGVNDYPVTAANNAAYIAGARNLEQSQGGSLRNRNYLFGDVVNSSPAYVKDTETIYVGANDGMLHAISAINGSELFTFIPSGINWSDLGQISRPDYAHRFFVDGPMVVSTRAQTPSQNVLVGALGKGGKGLFALDVTNPATFSARSYKWETSASNANIGLVQSRPVIAKLNDGSTAVIVANGINSTNGHAVLMIYNLQTGALIKEIDTGVGSGVDGSASSNGLFAPTGWDADGNGTVDYVYGGDMLGNVWKFDISGAATSNWVVSGGAPLFQAVDSNGAAQPITSGLSVSMHPTTYQTWVMFGTGRLMTVGDMSNKSVQTLYGFIDDGSAKTRRGANANLTGRSVVASGSYGGYPVRSFEPKTALPTGSKGWYVDLLQPGTNGSTAQGERVVSDSQVVGDVLIVSSVIPTSEACQPDGKGYLNALDAFTGTSTGPSLFDLNGDGSYTDEVLTSDGAKLPIGSVDLGVGMPTLADVLRGIAVLGGSSGGRAKVNVRETRNVGRVSWREIINN